MDRTMFENLDEREATRILTALSKAWESRDSSAIQRVSDRLPEGFALAVFAPKEGSPCFSIVSDTGFALEIPQGYSYIPEHQLIVSCLPVEEQEGDQPAIEEAGGSGVQGNLDLKPESPHGKSTEGGPQ